MAAVVRADLPGTGDPPRQEERPRAHQEPPRGSDYEVVMTPYTRSTGADGAPQVASPPGPPRGWWLPVAPRSSPPVASNDDDEVFVIKDLIPARSAVLPMLPV